MAADSERGGQRERAGEAVAMIGVEPLVLLVQVQYGTEATKDTS